MTTHTSLTLSRKEFESVVLLTTNDGQITVSVDKISNGQVKLNFFANKSVEILRTELLELELE